MSLDVKLNLIKTLKSKHNIGTQNALTYVRIQNEHALARQRTQQYLHKQGVEYSPSTIEVSNVSNFACDFLGYYLSLGQAGLEVLGIRDDRYVAEPTFAQRRLAILNNTPTFELVEAQRISMMLEVDYQRIINEFFETYSHTHDAPTSSRQIAHNIIEETRRPYVRDSCTFQPFYFNARRRLHDTLVKVSRSLPETSEGEDLDNDAVQNDAVEVMEFYRWLDGKPTTEEVLCELEESTLKGLTWEAKEFLLGYANVRTPSGQYYSVDVYWRAKRERTLNRTEIQRLIAINFCRGENHSSRIAAEEDLVMRIHQAQEALQDSAREIEIAESLEEYTQKLEVDASELAEDVIDSYRKDLPRYQDILWCIRSNQRWLDKTLGVNPEE